jgi:hypothetical protein
MNLTPRHESTKKKNKRERVLTGLTGLTGFLIGFVSVPMDFGTPPHVGAYTGILFVSCYWRCAP